MLWTCFTYLQLIPLIFTFSKCWGNPLELIGSKQICRCRAWTWVVYSEINFLYLIIAEMVGQAQSCAWGENHIRNFRPAIIQETNLRKKKKERVVSTWGIKGRWRIQYFSMVCLHASYLPLHLFCFILFSNTSYSLYLR